MVVNIGTFEDRMVGDEVVDTPLEVVLADHLEGGDQTGDQDDRQDTGSDALSPARVEPV